MARIVGGWIFTFLHYVFDRILLQPFYSGRARNPWINNDSSRPITDIKELDYNRRLIIYRDEEPRRQLREFEWPKDERVYGDPQNLYEDYYEEIYEYFHD